LNVENKKQGTVGCAPMPPKANPQSQRTAALRTSNRSALPGIFNEQAYPEQPGLHGRRPWPW